MITWLNGLVWWGWLLVILAAVLFAGALYLAVQMMRPREVDRLGCFAGVFWWTVAGGAALGSALLWAH
jgi:hypothetical protein